MSQERAGGGQKETTSTASHDGNAGASVGSVVNEKELCPCGEDPDDEDTFVCCDSCQQWWHTGCATVGQNQVPGGNRMSPPP